MVDLRRFSQFTPGIFPGQHDEPRLQDVPQVGTVRGVSAKGAVVEIDGQRGVTYGPAPWSLGSYSTAALAITGGFYPHTGDRCLIVFAGVGVETPILLAWWR